jgi:copper chaperone
MTTLTLVNIKCSGCANTITKMLKKRGCTNILVNPETQNVSFEGGNIQEVKSLLSKLGYPEKGSPEADSFLKKGKSFFSCAFGKIGAKEK